MKQLILFSTFLVVLGSCTSQKQASTKVGRSDDVYFTANDTRKKAEVPYKTQYRSYTENSLQNGQQTESNAGNYTTSYSNRLRYFGTSRRYYYDAYRPSLYSAAYFSSGWNIGLNYVNPMYGYMSGYNSPFSPYYGYNMPFYNPFFSYGWGNSWMNGYYPSYYYNPYFYNPCSIRYGYGYGYYNPNYNNYYYYKNNNNNYNNTNTNSNSYRRTGSSNNVPSSNTVTTQPQNSSQNSGGNKGGSWYGSGSSDRGGSGTSSGSGSRTGSGSSGGSGDRSSGGSGGSTRRR